MLRTKILENGSTETPEVFPTVSLANPVSEDQGAGIMQSGIMQSGVHSRIDCLQTRGAEHYDKTTRCIHAFRCEVLTPFSVLDCSISQIYAHVV